MNGLLLFGILLRLLVLMSAEYFNPDPHDAVIKYIVEKHALPHTLELGQSHHPPLYYLLMAPIYAWRHDFKVIHFVSFALSCANLVLIKRLMDRKDVIPESSARLLAFALLCFMPEFVMFESFVSNDPLAYLIGTLIFMSVLRYLAAASGKRMTLLAVLVGMGLLTKGTFLLTGAGQALLVMLVELRRKPVKRAIASVAAFCMIWTVLGCYKYVENAVYLGRPFAHNMDVQDIYVLNQTGTWKGPQTIYDINVLKLIRAPIMDERNTFSYPLLFYATAWYPHWPESSFLGNVRGYSWVGSLIYAVAIVPTIIFLLGIGRAVLASVHCLKSPAAAEDRSFVLLASLLLLSSNFAVVMAAGIRFDAYSCFQSRLCFQSMLPALVMFGAGMEWLSKPRALRGVVLSICWATVVSCVLYFIVEIGLVLMRLESRS